MNYNGKSIVLDRLPIVITERELKDYSITTLLNTYYSDEAAVKITEGLSMDLSKYIITDMNGSLVKYTSLEPSIVTIDSESGILSALKPGKTTVHIGNEEKSCTIQIYVLEKGAMGMLEEAAQSYIDRLDSLLEIEPSEENFEELFCEFSDILYFVSRAHTMYEEGYDYRGYLIVPNITFCFEFGEKLSYYYHRMWDSLINVQRKIAEVTEVNDKTITIKFDKPLTKPEIIDMRYSLYFPHDDYNKTMYWDFCSIYDKTGNLITLCDISSQSQIELAEGTDEITLEFFSIIRKGTYYIVSDYYDFNPVTFEYK